jgi:excinuclease ABC subunit A
LEYIFNGSDEPIEIKTVSVSGIKRENISYIEGMCDLITRRHNETSNDFAREYYSKYLSEVVCPECHGKKLSKTSLSVKIGGLDISEFTNLNISEAIEFIINLKLSVYEEEITATLIKEILDRLNFLENVGLYYLQLSRNAMTLSGGEAQRVRLATQIGSSLSGIIYVLDEPSIGLHQKDNEKLILSMKKMRDLGNTIIVVEHDTDTMLASDYIVDIGPGAGVNGGNIVAQGNVNDFLKNKNSLTAKYLNHELEIPWPKSRRSGTGGIITIKGATKNNLNNIDVTFPLGKIIAVTGVSGSGKSTLVNDILVANIEKALFKKHNPNIGKIRSILGIQNIDKIIAVDQEPIGRTPRSNPATYVGLFDEIRALYASLPESKARGYTKSRFSFNVPGGRCEKCCGDGVTKISMHFLPDVYVKCDECNGKKYNSETLSILYKEKNIFDVLEMSVDEALEFFKNIPSIKHKLDLLNEVGLGYIKLGEQATNLSGGEAQRIKLANFLQKKTSKNTILVLDEPTTGLHIDDIKKLIYILNRIADTGTTIVVIEHNLDFIKCCDHIIDLGPEGGVNGGKIIATGTPEQIMQKSDISYTGEYLKKLK